MNYTHAHTQTYTHTYTLRVTFVLFVVEEFFLAWISCFKFCFRCHNTFSFESFSNWYLLDIGYFHSSFFLAKGRKHKNDTQLSNGLWKIKASKEEPVLVWKILGQYQPCNVNTKRCLLCLNEKLQIAIHRGNNMLHKRTEIISKCRHRNKYALTSYDSMDWNIRCKVSWDYWNFWSFLQSDLL